VQKTVDKVGGRAKEAAGALTNTKSMKNEGRAGQVKGRIKEAADKIGDAVGGNSARKARK
jgi:uncharacterized protein YjbJ (UPF0337 family)